MYIQKNLIGNEAVSRKVMEEMLKWENKTETFTEKQRHYKNTYLEICEVYDGVVEVNLFSTTEGPYEIYVSYGRMYGIVYTEKEEAYSLRAKIKDELEKEYQNHKEPTSEFINMFAEKYKMDLPVDIFFDSSAFFEMFGF